MLRKIMREWPAAWGLAICCLVPACERGEAMEGDAVYEIEVPDMVCEGCVSTIQEALNEVKGVAEVRADVGEKRFRIGVDSSVLSDDSVITQAIRDAGYTPGGDAAEEAEGAE